MTSKTEFVVMTINAGGARRERGTKIAPEQIAKDLCTLITSTNIKPDIIAVQESHQVWEPDGSTLETSHKLAQKLTQGLGPSYDNYFSEYLDSNFHAHPWKWRGKKEPPPDLFKGYDRVQQGNAVITTKELALWPWGLPPEGYPGHNTRAPISTQISRATLYSTGNRDTEPRNLIVVPLSLGQGGALYFMAAHLTTLSREDRHDSRNPRSKEASDVRLAQVREILRVVDELRKAEQNKELKTPIILAGDFNARPCSPELATLEQIFLRPPPRWYHQTTRHGLISTHVRHKTHIDHIFYNDPDGLLDLKDCFVLDPSQVGTITDHLPVVAKFKIKR
jgi:endonuclease/exonuclease/phosphatase family metal-dependent hydrolase